MPPSAQVLVSPATGVSLPARVPATVAFSLTATASLVATGVAGSTLSVTVAVDDWPDASVMVYEKVSVPVKPGAGVYV